MAGLAETVSGVTNTYGNGEEQNTKHYYAGTMKKKRKGKKKCPKKSQSK